MSGSEFRWPGEPDGTSFVKASFGRSDLASRTNRYIHSRIFRILVFILGRETAYFVPLLVREDRVWIIVSRRF